MASGNYNPYNIGQYPQSSAQQYPTYQTAPQSSRQYQPNPSVATTQATDYMSYQAQSYGGQGNAYAGGQGGSWGGSSYGGNRETTSRAAEVLRNMSNTAYTPNPATAVTAPSFTPTNPSATNPTRYSSAAPQTQHVHQPPQSHTTHPLYGQSQARPRSVNTNRTQAATSHGIQSPAMAAGYPSQRTASPAQPQYGQSTQTPVSTARTAAMTAATQYNDYGRNRQLPNPDASRNAHNTAVSASYSYADNQATAPMAQTTSTNVPESYNQSTITVDPMAVYDPWPEYQRKQETLRAQKAVEDTARAEEERKAEEARKEEEHKKEEARKRQEDEEKARQAHSKQKARTSQTQSSATEANAPFSARLAQTLAGEPAMEAEIRALMAKMREFNSKDPALLARIWEEERRAKNVQNKATPQPAPAQPVPTSVTQAANQRKKAASKETATANTAKPAQAAAPPVAKPPGLGVASARPGGSTIWPPEKKTQLAAAATTYLNGQNLANPLTSDQILSMLDGNPSYIELCEQLEAMNLKLDRAAFAKNLLTAVPDANSASRQAKPAAGPVNGAIAQKAQVAPPAVMKRGIASPAAASPHHMPAAAASPANRSPYPSFPDNSASAPPSPVPVAEMVPIKPELKPPANKEEAARKRTFNDLIDLTQLEDEDDLEPPPKRATIGFMYSYGSPGQSFNDAMDIDEGSPVVNNFPIPARATPQPVHESASAPPVNELRYIKIVEPLDRRNALRRNTYNIKTIARDVLIACGRHPETRQLNQHLEVLKEHLPHVTNDSDLSTLRWDLIDPGNPPPGYFKAGVQALAEDADDEEDSEDERDAARRASTQAIGGDAPTAEARVSALPEATNPFKQKRRGRPPRHSYPADSTTPSTPKRATSTDMSASAPRPAAAAASVGYSAFRSATGYGPDGKPLPKKKGRPVGWRKAIHGSAAAQSRPSGNKWTGPLRHVPSQPSSLRNVSTGPNEPIRIGSSSPGVPNKTMRYQSFACKWQNCKAELHNLETLKKHVYKVHRKESLGGTGGTLECLWSDCGNELASHDLMTNMRIERHEPKSFDNEDGWRAHLEEAHFSPLSWKLGDGPAGGLSGK